MWQTVAMATTVGIRARVRAELIQEIKDQARRQVAEAGASALSLRAVARELGMVSSAIYRYFPSRDELLTALIIDAYDDLGATTETADGACRSGDFTGRWRAVCHAVHDWAREHSHEYALVYGSPVPGYRAPETTIGPASRVNLALATIVREAAAAGALSQPFAPGRTPKLSARAAAEAERANSADAARSGPVALLDVPGDAVVRAYAAWTQLFGFISFELFGHLDGVIEDRDAIFDQVVDDIGAFVGLPPPPRPGRQTRG